MGQVGLGVKSSRWWKGRVEEGLGEGGGLGRKAATIKKQRKPKREEKRTRRMVDEYLTKKWENKKHEKKKSKN